MIAERVLEKAIQGITYCENDKSLDDYLDHLEENRGIVGSILFNYFRYKSFIEYIIGNYADGVVEGDLEKLISVATVQIIYQDGLEPEKVVFVAVEYAKMNISRNSSRFVNAILRKIVKLRRKTTSTRKLAKSLKWDRKNYIPSELYNRWVENYGYEKVGEIIKNVQTPEEYTYFRILNNKSVNLEELFAEKVDCLEFESKFEFYRTKDIKNLVSSDDLAKGNIYIQDPATALSTSATSVANNNIESVYDACSAPGGKTIMLSELFSGAKIYAGDKSEFRIERVKENIKRCGLTNVETFVGDISKNKPPIDTFDIVFLDVPCSNSGVMRKRPDAIWKDNAKCLDEIVLLQRKILKKSKKYVKVGGLLAYSTCSIEIEENLNQIERFLDINKDFTLLTKNQILPNSNHDGAFVAILKRES